MPSLLSVAERNDVPTTDHSGSLNPGGSFAVQGIARAGTSATGIGSWFQGTYGALLLNADGSYVYRLDNRDPDTEVLGAGQMADDRFTYTYVQNGVSRTDTFIVRVTGVDEPEQQITTGNATVTFNTELEIGSLQQYRINAIHGVIVNADAFNDYHVVNRGMVRVEAPPTNGGVGMSVSRLLPAGVLELANYGLIEAHAGTNAYQTIGVGASGGGTVVNHGVIRSIAAGVNSINYAQATGSGGRYITNTGTIEAISTLEAWAARVDRGLDNYGLIYAEGSARFNVPGIVGAYASQAAGVTINNYGTIWAVSNNASAPSFGVAMFRDSTNFYAYATVNNSGRIVADIAVMAYGTSVGGITGLHVFNSGHVEGTFDMDLGLNMLINQVGGEWIGAVRGGVNEDAIRNLGLLQGTVNLGSGDDLFDGRGGILTGSVEGGDGVDVILGGSGNDALSGGSGSDRIQGGGGADSLTGGSDSDIFAYLAVADSTGAAFDTISDFQSGVDKIDLTALAPTGIGFSGAGGYTMLTAQTASGTITIRIGGTIGAADVLTAPKGATITGTEASDVLFALIAGSQVSAGSGHDVIDGSIGNDSIDGGAGIDLMRGGLGDDIYYADDFGDRVIEFDGEGIDELRVIASARMQAYVENLTMLGIGDLFASGNRLANIITGNDGRNDIFGDDGDDILIGGGGGDSLQGATGRDIYVYQAASDSTTSAPDRLFFVSGEDRIDLRAVSPTSITWQETMLGYWQNFAISSVLTVVTATGTMKINVDGKLFASDFLMGGEIVGGDGNDSLGGTANGDVIIGGLGNDSLSGNGGGDTLSGQEGADLLDGGAGADSLVGGFGNDIYLVDNSADIAWELGGQGFDRVVASASYVLPARSSIEILETIDANRTDPINLTGNTFDNLIYGNAGNNILSGGKNVEDPLTYIPTGSDTLVGFGGNDTYLIDGGLGDTIIEAIGGGFDTVIVENSFVLAAGVEIELLAAVDPPSIYAAPVNLTGNAFNQTLRGNGTANILDGGAGDDTLVGGAGSDTLNGGADADTLDYRSNIAAVIVSLSANSASGGHADGDIISNFENVTGSAFGDRLTGDDKANVLDGGDGDDFLDLSGGGADRAIGGAGNDGFLFGAAFTGADHVDGGAGANDQIGLQGDYTGGSALTLGANTVTGVEVLAVLAGFSYNITTVDANVAAGQVLKIQATQLAAGHSLTFNASAETDGSLIVYGGQGNDTMIGGQGNDGFYFGPGGFNAADLVVGGGGSNDQLALDGNYAMTIGGNVSGVEVIVLLGGPAGQPNSFNIALDEAFVGGGETKAIFGLQVTTTIVFDGSGEHDGLLRIYGGSTVDALTGSANADWIFGSLGGDTLTGGGGRDTFYYDSAAQSTGTGFDRLIGFDDDNGADLIDLPFAVTGFAAAQSGALNAADFDSTLEGVFTGLGGHQAALFTGRGGDMDGRTFLVVDADGSGGYQRGVDYVMEFVSPLTPIDNLGIFV